MSESRVFQYDQISDNRYHNPARAVSASTFEKSVKVVLHKPDNVVDYEWIPFAAGFTCQYSHKGVFDCFFDVVISSHNTDQNSLFDASRSPLIDTEIRVDGTYLKLLGDTIVTGAKLLGSASRTAPHYGTEWVMMSFRQSVQLLRTQIPSLQLRFRVAWAPNNGSFVNVIHTVFCKMLFNRLQLTPIFYEPNPGLEEEKEKPPKRGMKGTLRRLLCVPKPK